MREAEVLSRYRWVILLVTGLVILVVDFMQFQLSALAYVVMPSLGIDVAQFSALLFAPMLAGAVFGIPAGSLADRFGCKPVVTVALLVSVFAGFGRLGADCFPSMFVMMFGVGVAASAVQSVCLKLYGLWFGLLADFAMGVFFAFSCVGIALGLMAATWFESIEAAYLFSSSMLVLALIVWVLLIREHRGPSDGASDCGGRTAAAHLKAAFSSRDVWLIALACGLGLAMSTNYSGILPQALIEVRGVDPSTAGFMAAVLRVLSIPGAVVGPLLCRRNVRRSLVVVSLLGGIVMLLNWAVPPGSSLFWALLVVNGVLTVIPGPVLEALPCGLSEIGVEHAASAGGVICSVSLMLSFFVPVIVGSLSGGDYWLNFMLTALGYALAAVPILFLSRIRPGAS